MCFFLTQYCFSHLILVTQFDKLKKEGCGMAQKIEYYYSKAKSLTGEPVLISERRIAPGSERMYSLILPMGKNDIEPVQLFLCGETVCAPDYLCRFYDATHACMMHFQRGSGKLSVDGKSYDIAAGDTVLMREGCDWEYETNPDDPWQLVWLNLQDAYSFSLLALYELPSVARFSDPEVATTLKSIISEIKHNSHSLQTRDSVLQQLLRLVQHMALLITDRRNSKKQARDAYTIMEYINAHLMENIKVGDLSKLVFRSGGGAANAFRAVYNCSIKDYILRAKLEVAARLLRENEQQVSEIADMLSFCDAQHFSRMFRQRYSMSPSRYRKLFRSTPSGDTAQAGDKEDGKGTV